MSQKEFNFSATIIIPRVEIICRSGHLFSLEDEDSATLRLDLQKGRIDVWCPECGQWQHFKMEGRASQVMFGVRK